MVDATTAQIIGGLSRRIQVLQSQVAALEAGGEITGDVSAFITNENLSVTVLNDSVSVTVLNTTLSVELTNDSIITDLSTTNATAIENNNQVIGQVLLGNNMVMDAFSRVRISNPETLFESNLELSSQNNIWDTSALGTGSTTYNSNQASLTLTVTNPGDNVIRQSFQSTRYQPGKSLLSMFSLNMNDQDTDVTKHVGLFDSSNGIFFEVTGTSVAFVLRSNTTGSVVDTTIDQASWNIDPLDGNGPSGYSLDLTKTKLFFVDLQWLGVGRVRLGFFIGGRYILCHEILNLTQTTVYMTRASLPCRYEISSQGGSGSLTQICTTVISEGGFQPKGYIRSFGTGFATSSANRAFNTNANNYFVLTAIRLRAGFERATLVPLNFNAGNTGSENMHVIIAYGAPISNSSGPTPVTDNDWFQVSDAVEAIVSNDDDQYIIPSSAFTQRSGTSVSYDVLTTGTVVGETFIIGTSRLTAEVLDETNLTLGSSIDGARTSLILAGRLMNGTSNSTFGSITWREIF